MSISNIWTFGLLLLTSPGALFVTMHHNNHDAYFNFPLTSCETNNSTDNYYCLSYMYLNSAKHVGTPALITCPCLLSRGPWNLWDLHSGHSAQGTLVLWAPISFLLTGITWLLTFCDVCKISLTSTQSWSSQDRTRIDLKWRSIGKEFNIIPVGLVHCTAPHPTGFYFWCWVPRVSACISNNASLCQMERTQIVQKRETQYLSSISFSELVGKQEGCREIWFAPTTVTAETSQTIKSS